MPAARLACRCCRSAPQWRSIALPLFALIDRWRAPPPKPRKVAWLARYAYAHRGLHGSGVAGKLAPLPSPPQSGAGSGIELDVQRSERRHADGVPRLRARPDDWRERADSPHAPPRNSARSRLPAATRRIPSLRQVLDCVAGKVPLLIEIKTRAEHPGAGGLPRGAARARRLSRAARGDQLRSARVALVRRRTRRLTVRGLTVTEEGNLTLAFRIKRAGWRCGTPGPISCATTSATCPAASPPRSASAGCRWWCGRSSRRAARPRRRAGRCGDRRRRRGSRELREAVTVRIGDSGRQRSRPTSGTH